MYQHQAANSLILILCVAILIVALLITSKRTGQPSFRARMLNGLLTWNNAPQHFADAVCNATPSLTHESAGAPPNHFFDKYRISKSTFNGFPIYKISPRGKYKITRQVLYMFGGAYVLPIQAWQYETIVSNFLDNCGYSVVVPIYGRAPAYTYKDLIPLMDHAFVNMSREHPQRDVILCGDSSGGNAIMMLSNRIPMLISQNAGVSAPICSVLISPWADPCGTNAEAWNLRKSDPLLHASAGKQAIEWFSNGENLLSTPLCPMIDDSEPFRNYSYPFILITGTCEMLNADHRAMKHKAAQAGVTCYFLEYEELMHDFPVIPFLPESHEVLQTVAQILKHTIPSMVDGKL